MRFVFMFQFSHHSFGPLLTTRLKRFYFSNYFVVSCLFNGVPPLHHLCESEEAENPLVALLMVRANYLNIF
jgi:hypothetical protein